MTASLKPATDREIIIERRFDAPRELVFRAFIDPGQLPHWFGPEGFTLTTEAIDVRPGGTWKFVFHGPDGVDYPNIITYREISPFDLLVYDHGEPGDEVQFATTITFEDVGGKTHLTMASLFPTAESREHVVREYGAIEGGMQTLERLARHVAGLISK
jgi:uncharacterized protein YndB with AHSA1/START domain